MSSTLPTIPPPIKSARPSTSFVGITPQNTPCDGLPSQPTPGIATADFQPVSGWEPERETAESWRPGDDAMLVGEPDTQLPPRPLNASDPRAVSTGKLHRLKRTCRTFFNLSEQNHPGSLHQLSNTGHAKDAKRSKDARRPKGANQRKRRRELEIDAVTDIIKRKTRLTGRSLTVGGSEVRILPEATRAKLLYYLMEDRGHLQIVINDLGKETVDPYPEYEDDLVIMRWLIRSKYYSHFAFSVDNLCCRACVSGWRMKVREYHKYVVTGAV